MNALSALIVVVSESLNGYSVSTTTETLFSVKHQTLRQDLLKHLCLGPVRWRNCGDRLSFYELTMCERGVDAVWSEVNVNKRLLVSCGHKRVADKLGPALRMIHGAATGHIRKFRISIFRNTAPILVHWHAGLFIILTGSSAPVQRRWSRACHVRRPEMSMTNLS